MQTVETKRRRTANKIYIAATFAICIQESRPKGRRERGCKIIVEKGNCNDLGIGDDGERERGGK